MSTPAEAADKLFRIAYELRDTEERALAISAKEGIAIIDATLASEGGFKIGGQVHSPPGTGYKMFPGEVHIVPLNKGWWSMVEFGTKGAQPGMFNRSEGVFKMVSGRKGGLVKKYGGRGDVRALKLPDGRFARRVKGRKAKNTWEHAAPLVAENHARNFDLNTVLVIKSIL